MNVQPIVSPAAVLAGQSRAVAGWKVVEFAALGAFALVVPRLMGPDLYGRFAVVLSVLGVVTVAADLGGLPILGRFMQEYRARGEWQKAQDLFAQLFWLRGLLVALLAVGIVVWLPRLLTGVSWALAALVGAALVTSTLAVTSFQAFYGLNALGRWRVHDSLARIVLLVLLAAFQAWASLDRAVVALLATQVVFLALGLAWVRGTFPLRLPRIGLAFLWEHLRFGLLFFAANLLLVLMWRSGELVVLLLSARPAEVAFFSVASTIAMTLASFFGQIAAMTIPTLTALQVSGAQAQSDALLGHTLKYLTMGAFCMLYIIHAAGPWFVERVIGVQFLPVAANLRVLAFGLLPVVLIGVGVALAVVGGQPGRAVWVSAAAFGTFIGASALLIPRAGSYGASLAVVVGIATAGIVVCRQFPLGPAFAAARFWRLVLAGALGMFVAILPISPVARAVGALALFIALLFAGRVLNLAELRRMGRLLAR